MTIQLFAGIAIVAGVFYWITGRRHRDGEAVDKIAALSKEGELWLALEKTKPRCTAVIQCKDGIERETELFEPYFRVVGSYAPILVTLTSKELADEYVQYFFHRRSFEISGVLFSINEAKSVYAKEIK